MYSCLNFIPCMYSCYHLHLHSFISRESCTVVLVEMHSICIFENIVKCASKDRPLNYLTANVVSVEIPL